MEIAPRIQFQASLWIIPCTILSILFSNHSWQILDDVCQKNAWGTPVYQLHSTKYREGSGEVQLFLYKVIVFYISTFLQKSSELQMNGKKRAKYTGRV